MADEAHEHISVAASPTRLFELATDYERYPEWARDVKQVDVLERDGDGRGSRVEYRVAGLGKSIRYVLEYDYAEAPAAFSWHFVEGDWLRQLDGRYGFEAEDGGTRVTLRPRRRRLGAAARVDQAPRREHDHGNGPERAEEGGGAMSEPLREHDRPEKQDTTTDADASDTGAADDTAGPDLGPPTAIESLIAAMLEAGPRSPSTS